MLHEEFMNDITEDFNGWWYMYHKESMNEITKDFTGL